MAILYLEPQKMQHFFSDSSKNAYHCNLFFNAKLIPWGNNSNKESKRGEMKIYADLIRRKLILFS